MINDADGRFEGGIERRFTAGWNPDLRITFDYRRARNRASSVDQTYERRWRIDPHLPDWKATFQCEDCVRCLVDNHMTNPSMLGAKHLVPEPVSRHIAEFKGVAGVETTASRRATA